MNDLIKLAVVAGGTLVATAVSSFALREVARNLYIKKALAENKANMKKFQEMDS